MEILHSFGGGKEKKDGGNPYAGIVFDANGKIHGTTNGGGKLNDGTVFELAQTGQGWYREKILWSFNGTDGLWPRSAPVLDREGNLYGTTVFGGLNNDGVVFEVTSK
ncbi:MAG: choice-of-anchor tandem repeat GloVer-containing protein [Terriglobales bacterium]